jgi:hypothetical protein
MSNDSPSSKISSSYHCPDCGSKIGFQSRRRTFSERYLLPFVLLRPVRCGECFRRDYRMIFTPVHQRLSDTTRMVPRKQTVTSSRNVA